jgi:SAM-dependent methyltransferase
MQTREANRPFVGKDSSVPLTRTGVDGKWNHNVAYFGDVLDALPDDADSVLDIGCGDGLLARLISPRANQVIGLDVDRALVEGARQLSAGYDNLEFVHGDFLAVALADRQFDLISAIASLHHMPFEAALTKAETLLRPGGRMVIVGLARSRSPLDFATDGAAVIASRIGRARRGWWNHPAPVMEPAMSYRDVHHAVSTILPGCEFRRRLYFRYTVTWTRPEAPTGASAG